MARMFRPETVNVPISDGDWLLVKKRLTAGETRQYLSGARNPATDKLDGFLVGPSRALAYLVDWSIKDADGKPVVIRDQPEDTVRAALDALDPDSYREINDAVAKHEAAMDAEREQEKKAKSGAGISEMTYASAAP